MLNYIILLLAYLQHKILLQIVNFIIFYYIRYICTYITKHLYNILCIYIFKFLFYIDDTYKTNRIYIQYMYNKYQWRNMKIVFSCQYHTIYSYKLGESTI